METVVKLSEIEEGIVQVTMEDRLSRNTFSEGFIKGIMEAFETIKNTPAYKVVVLTGYDNYFCCGGTKEELFKIYKGEKRFNDFKFFTLPLECQVPVISAMQGHAIGGGLVFGLYADFSILGKENMYTANFMKYGFTPGMGGTYIIPLRLGEALGNEMLFTAENYRGGELKERGVLLKVVPKNEVLTEAMTLAKSLAEKPRKSLITLKEHISAPIKNKLSDIIKKELAMHTLTFHQPEVAERIEALFGS